MGRQEIYFLLNSAHDLLEVYMSGRREEEATASQIKTHSAFDP